MSAKRIWFSSVHQVPNGCSNSPQKKPIVKNSEWQTAKQNKTNQNEKKKQKKISEICKQKKWQHIFTIYVVYEMNSSKTVKCTKDNNNYKTLLPL